MICKMENHDISCFFVIFHSKKSNPWSKSQKIFSKIYEKYWLQVRLFCSRCTFSRGYERADLDPKFIFLKGTLNSEERRRRNTPKVDFHLTKPPTPTPTPPPPNPPLILFRSSCWRHSPPYFFKILPLLEN